MINKDMVNSKVGNSRAFAWFIVLLVVGSAIALSVQEVTQGSASKVFFEVKNSTNGAETGATCTVNVWYQNGTSIANNTATSRQGGGIYYFTTSATWQPSRMQAEVACNTIEGLAYTGIEFQVVGTTTQQYLSNIQADIGDPSAAGTTIYGYLLNTIKTLIDTITTRLGIPTDYGYNNVSAMLNTTLMNQQNKLVTVAGTVTDASGTAINGATVDVGVQGCSDVGTCTPTVIGGYYQISTSNGRYDAQFTRSILPGQLYRVNTTIYSGASVTTTYSYFTN